MADAAAAEPATSPARSPTQRGAATARSSSKMSMHSQNTMNTMNSRRSNASRRSIKIDLNNFDENRLEPPFLTSPRSLEACRKQGVLPEELVHKPPSFFGQDKTVPPRVVELRYQTYNTARKERLRVVMEAYKELCQPPKVERQGSGEGSITQRSSTEDEEAKLIEKVMKQMEFQKQKQKEEVETMLLLEMRAQRIKEKAEAKEAEKAARAAELAAAKALKDAEWQEQKAAMEARKREEEVMTPCDVVLCFAVSLSLSLSLSLW
jgi:hypothetical protein